MSNTSAQFERPIAGSDTDGHSYNSTKDMWAKELRGDLYDLESGWYGKALNFWKNTPATVSGVLGGMDHVHDVDIACSRAFIDSLPDHGTSHALDCGAGIGRITKSLLRHLYTTVDIMEPVEHMLEKAKEELASYNIGEYMLSSMENAQLRPNMYDLIMIQWTAIYLTDDDFVKFFAHCKQALTPRGYIVFKENVSGSDNFVVDKEDSSLTRSDYHYKLLLAAAGVSVVKQEVQSPWPENLFQVNIYGLK